MRHVSSPVFVGRESELARLGEAFDDAARGRATFLLVAGEAGVGKTRFADTAIALARARGLPVLAGSCLDMGGDAQAFAPLRESLRRLRSEIGPEAFERLVGTRREGLGMLLSGAEAAGPRLETLGVGAESGQARLFDGWLGLLRQLGTAAPPLFIVEDLHWADRSTFDLLRYLAHNDLEVPFVVLATFRSDELHRTHPLVPVLVELQRKPSVVRLELRRFERTETAELIHAIRGPGADAGVIDLIHDRSDGNAFYVEQLLIAEAAGGVIPDSLREILLATVGTLQAETQELLRCASVGGQRLSTRVLGRVMDREPADLEASLREAVDRHLLVPIEDAVEERFMFRHALVQEAIRGEVLPGRRARLHGLF
ncbi:MAG TPA: AAA family ATPase, partial [Candidatus Eisenbacteria bacterium]|nr:AAA family ATPase [Candidatus Eisenbacteria bacterium]